MHRSHMIAPSHMVTLAHVHGSRKTAVMVVTTLLYEATKNGLLQHMVATMLLLVYEAKKSGLLHQMYGGDHTAACVSNHLQCSVCDLT